MSGDKENRKEADFYKLPGGGLIDPQGEPMADNGQEIDEELPPESGEKAPKPRPSPGRDRPAKDRPE